MFIRFLMVSLLALMSVTVKSEVNSHPDYLAIKLGMNFQEIDEFVQSNGLVYEKLSPIHVVIRDNETTYIPNIEIAVQFCEPLMFESQVVAIFSMERFVNDDEATYSAYKMIEKHRNLLAEIFNRKGTVIGSRTESERGKSMGMQGNAVKYQLADNSTWELGIFRRAEEDNFNLQLVRMDFSDCPDPNANNQTSSNSGTTDTKTENDVSDAQAVMAGLAYIQDEVRKRWVRPADARNGMEVELRIHMVPTGEVINMEVTYRKNASDAFVASVQKAVKKVGRFDKLSGLDPVLFDANFRSFKIIFKPEDLRL